MILKRIADWRSACVLLSFLFGGMNSYPAFAIDGGRTSPNALTLSEANESDRKNDLKDYLYKLNDWKSRVPSGDVRSLLGEYKSLVALAPKVGRAGDVCALISNMADAAERDPKEIGLAIGFLVATSECNKAPGIVLDARSRLARKWLMVPGDQAVVESTKILVETYENLGPIDSENVTAVNSLLQVALKVFDAASESGQVAEQLRLAQSVASAMTRAQQNKLSVDWNSRISTGKKFSTKSRESAFRAILETLDSESVAAKLEHYEGLFNLVNNAGDLRNALSTLETLGKYQLGNVSEEELGRYHCAVGELSFDYLSAMDKDRQARSDYAWSKSDRAVLANGLEGFRVGTSLASRYPDKGWSTYCNYSFSFALSHGMVRGLDQRNLRAFELRLAAAESFFRMGQKSSARAAFISSAHLGMVGVFPIDEKDALNQGMRLGCDAFARGAKLGLYSPSEEAKASDWLATCLSQSWWK